MPARKSTTAILPVEVVQQRIAVLRGQRIIMDADLARLYGVTTKRLNQQIKRNADRFPKDFMFRLTWEEADALRSQFATLNSPETKSRSRSQIATLNRGANTKYLPHVFTEHGAIMAATVLNSPRAVKASLFVVRAFVKLREFLSTHRELGQKLDELERKVQDHDGQIGTIIEAIRELMEEPEEPAKPPVGFQTELQGTGRSARTRRLR